MEEREFYRVVAGKLPRGVERTAAVVTHAVLAALAERLCVAEARQLAAALPRPIATLLRRAHGDDVLDRDTFIEDVASRLDVDDDAAEGCAASVLSALRVRAARAPDFSQLFEGLPADLQRLMG